MGEDLKKTFYNCKKATYLIEKRQLDEITSAESCDLELHLKCCTMCKTYMKQSALINYWISKVFVIKDSDLRLDDEFKKKLQECIDAALDKKKPRRFFNPNGKNRNAFDKVG